MEMFEILSFLVSALKKTTKCGIFLLVQENKLSKENRRK